MLILTRRPGEAIVIDGRIIVKVLEAQGHSVRLGIDAPKDVPVHREEIQERVRREKRQRGRR